MPESTRSKQAHITAFGLCCLVAFMVGCQKPSPPIASGLTVRPKVSVVSVHDDDERRYVSLLMDESLGESPARMFRRFRLLRSQVSSRRVRALCMRQEIRLLVKSKQMAKARKLAGRLARLFPRQVDVHVAWGVGKAMGADDPSLSMTWHGASYREVVKQLVAKGGWRVRELPRKPRGARRVVLRCQKARWLDVVRALVWSMGDDLHVDAGRKLVRVVPGVSRMGKTVDLSTKEVPDVLRLVVGVARKTGVSLVLRRPSFSLQEGDIHIFPAFGVVRGSGRARALFRKRLRLLPYGLLVKAFAHKPLSPGWGEDALFLGVMSISARLLFPVLVQPASQPLSRPVSRPAPKPGKRSLSADDVRQVIRARKSGVRLCFERFRTEMDGRKRVRLIVRLVVTSSGRVKKVAFPVKIQGLVRLKGCMKEWGLLLRFARTTGRRTVIHYPFVFQVP